jgi:TetR/AcrR family transcriptional repressor of nem operon
MARPPGFDRDQVLERATEAFWARGYGDTSIGHLVEATRLQPGSLYAAFKSKQGLFLAALDHYAQHSRENLQQTLDAAPDPVTGILTFFDDLANGGEAARRGCLLVNTVLEVGRSNPTVRARVASHLAAIEATFCAALEEARANGLLDRSKSPESLAKFLMAMIWGLRVLGGTGADTRSMRLVVGQVQTLLRG